MNIKQLAQLILEAAEVREASYVPPARTVRKAIEDFSQYYTKSIAVAAAEVCDATKDEEAAKCIIPITLLLTSNWNVTLKWAQHVARGIPATYEVHPPAAPTKPSFKGE